MNLLRDFIEGSRQIAMAPYKAVRLGVDAAQAVNRGTPWGQANQQRVNQQMEADIARRKAEYDAMIRRKQQATYQGYVGNDLPAENIAVPGVKQNYYERAKYL